MAGEKREPPVVEFKAVDETTPQFKNFYVKNVVCNGAEKGFLLEEFLKCTSTKLI
jgi:hypothetical protein